VSDGFAIAHTGDVERLHSLNGNRELRPVRRHFGIHAFAVNVWEGDTGRLLVPEHDEEGGQEELYVVLRGGALFTIGGEEHEAGPGTLVFARPGTKRSAVATGDDSAILAIGGKPGEAFVPARWEEVVAAYSHAKDGDVDRGRSVVEAIAAAEPETWRHVYNAACYEARFGDRERAVEHLLRAGELDGEAVAGYAPGDSDLDAIRADPRVSAVARKAAAAGPGA